LPLSSNNALGVGMLSPATKDNKHQTKHQYLQSSSISLLCLINCRVGRGYAVTCGVEVAKGSGHQGQQQAPGCGDACKAAAGNCRSHQTPRWAWVCCHLRCGDSEGQPTSRAASISM
jgi:hypothetical protein